MSLAGRFMSALAALLASTAAHAGCTAIKSASLPIQLWGQKLLVPASINGTSQFLAVDTGASTTLIASAVASSLNILRDFDRVAVARGVGGVNSAVDIGKVDNLTLGQLSFTNKTMLIVDLPMRGPNNQPVAGFLGADILAHYDVDLDLPGRRMTLWHVQDCPNFQPPWADAGDKLPIGLDEQGHILVPLKVDGAALTGLLDTGAPMLVLTPRAAARAGVTDDGAGGDIALNGTGVNNREWDGRLHRFPSVEFAGDETRFMPAEIINGTSLHQYETLLSGSDGLVGLTVLHKHRLWISYQTKTIFVQPRGPSVGAGD
jgi:predicted aspartyl protease